MHRHLAYPTHRHSEMYAEAALLQTLRGGTEDPVVISVAVFVEGSPVAWQERPARERETEKGTHTQTKRQTETVTKTASTATERGRER